MRGDDDNEGETVERTESTETHTETKPVEETTQVTETRPAGGPGGHHEEMVPDKE